jgi:putative transposase
MIRMSRQRRCFRPGHIYHILNRGVRRHRLFAEDEDYQHFQQLMGAAQVRVPLRIVSYCLMPNHWHIVVWPESSEAISEYFRWLTWSHACHFNASHDLSGHVYQGPFRSVAVKHDRHLLTLLRYVESNPARAQLVERAEHWRWSSLNPCPRVRLTDSPVARPTGWLDLLFDPKPGIEKRPGCQAPQGGLTVPGTSQS